MNPDATTTISMTVSGRVLDATLVKIIAAFLSEGPVNLSANADGTVVITPTLIQPAPAASAAAPTAG